MYIILVYDAAPSRGAKLLKFLRRHLTWVQNSVFEGELTTAQFYMIESELYDIIDEDEDCVICYTFGSRMYSDRLIFGKEKNSLDTFI